MSSIKDIETNIKQVIELLKTGWLVPFVGAGVSFNTGAPLWGQLAKELASKVDCSEHDEPTFITQYYANLFGRSALEKHVKRLILPPKPWDLEIQNLICRWPVDLIITTNFDPFLENSCHQLGIEYQVFCFDDRISHWESYLGLRIFKPHGDLDHRIIITEQDYQEYEAQHPSSLHLLQNIFYTRPILFIGCSLSDPNFRRAFHWTRSVLQQSEIQRYALLPSTTSHEMRMWERFGINIIPFERSGKNEIKDSLKEILEEVSRHCLREARSLEERQQIFVDYEAAYLESSVLLRNLIVRKESCTSFIGIPEDGTNVFLDHDMPDQRMETAIQRKTVYRRFIQEGANVKLILSVNPSFIEKRGYSIDAVVSRLLALRSFIREYMALDNFDVVKRMPGLEYRRFSLYNSDFLIESIPLHLHHKRIERAVVLLNRTLIKHTEKTFDEKFQVFLELNLRDAKAAGIGEKGRSRTAIVKQYLIQEIDLEIENLRAGGQL